MGRSHPRVGHQLPAAAGELRRAAAAHSLQPSGVGPPPREACPMTEPEDTNEALGISPPMRTDESAPGEGGPDRAGMRIQSRMYLGVAAFVALVAVVYWFGSYEEAGTVMLLLAGVMAAMSGGYLLSQAR